MPTIPYVRATHSDGQPWNAAKANILEAGVNDVSYAPCVHVTHNTTQSILNSTNTVLAFNTERFDQAGNTGDTMHDTVTNNSRLTCRYAGVYLITANVEWAANTTGYRAQFIRLNGTTQISPSQTTTVPAASLNVSFSVTTLYALAVNDYVEVVVSQNSGGALNVVNASSYSPDFMMARVG